MCVCVGEKGEALLEKSDLDRILLKSETALRGCGCYPMNPTNWLVWIQAARTWLCSISHVLSLARDFPCLRKGSREALRTTLRFPSPKCPFERHCGSAPGIRCHMLLPSATICYHLLSSYCKSCLVLSWFIRRCQCIWEQTRTLVIREMSSLSMSSRSELDTCLDKKGRPRCQMPRADGSLTPRWRGTCVLEELCHHSLALMFSKIFYFY